MFRAANAEEEWGLILISAFSLLWISLCVIAVIFVLSTEQQRIAFKLAAFYLFFSKNITNPQDWFYTL